MYLPRNLPLCEPHVFTWIGASGKRYEFAVSRPAASWLDQAAVFVLVRRQGQEMKVLHVGHTGSLHLRFGRASERCPEIWRRALAAGMTQVHLRFDACSERQRLAEVRDLRAGLRPTLEEVRGLEYEPPDRLAGQARTRSTSADDVLVPYRAKLKPTRQRDPHVDVEASRMDPGHVDLPLGHAFEAPRLHRADPAREAFVDDDAPAGGDDAVPIWRDFAADPASTDEPVSVAIPLQAQVVTEARSRRDAEAEAALEKTSHVADNDAFASSADAPAASRRPAGPPAPPHREAGVFSRLMSIAAARCRLWLNAARRSAAAKSPVVLISPPEHQSFQDQPQSFQDARPAEHRGQTVLDEGGFSLGTSDDLPSGDPAPDGYHAAASGDAVATDQAERAAASDSIAEERPALAVEVKEEPVRPAETLVSSNPASAITPILSRESVEAVKRGLGLEATAPIVLFAGALSYDAGADIFADALITVCGGDASAQFVFVGEGPLRGDLEGRLHGAGLGGRCRFVGDAPADRFQQLLEACTFVVIPARVAQGEELARQALAFGKPVLVTHQSGIQCVEHGKTGLITYDNPGSFVWGIREILGPLGAKLGGAPAEAA
jgi:glycosyltransferase involved in cell wall biosynthesis